MDYINDILNRLKQCALCGTKFIDLTYNQNRKYCSKECREVIGNKHDLEYQRKRRRLDHLRGKPFNHSLGTFSQNWLDRHIAQLYKQIARAR